MLGMHDAPPSAPGAEGPELCCAAAPLDHGSALTIGAAAVAAFFAVCSARWSGVGYPN